MFSKLREWLDCTFIGQIAPILLVVTALGLFSSFKVTLWGSLVVLGVWALFSLVVFVRLPRDDDGGCAGTLLVYFFYLIMVETALWISFGVSSAFRIYVLA